MKKFNENISPMKLTLTNFENKINDLINDKVLNFLKEKDKNFDDLIKSEINLIKIEDTNNFFEKNKKILEEIKEEKSKIENLNDVNKLKDLEDKNKILQEKIKNLLEEKKVNEELIDEKNMQMQKANAKIKLMQDKLYDVNEFIKKKCKNESFVKKISTICNVD